MNNDEKQAVLTLVARAIAQLLTLAGAVNVGPHIAVSRHNNRLHVALNWSGTSVVDVTETTLRTAANTALADIKRIAQAYSLNDAVKRALTWLAGTYELGIILASDSRDIPQNPVWTGNTGGIRHPATAAEAQNTGTRHAEMRILARMHRFPAYLNTRKTAPNLLKAIRIGGTLFDCPDCNIEMDPMATHNMAGFRNPPVAPAPNAMPTLASRINMLNPSYQLTPLTAGTHKNYAAGWNDPNTPVAPIPSRQNGGVPGLVGTPDRPANAAVANSPTAFPRLPGPATSREGTSSAHGAGWTHNRAANLCNAITANAPANAVATGTTWWTAISKT